MTPQKLCRKSMTYPAQSLFRIAFLFSAVQRIYRKNFFHPTFLLLRVEWDTIPHLSQPLFRIAVLSSAVQRFYQKINFHPTFLLLRVEWETMPHTAQPFFRIAVPSSTVQRFYQKNFFHPTLLLLRVEWETMPHPDQPFFFLLLQVARILSINLPSTSLMGSYQKPIRMRWRPRDLSFLFFLNFSRY